VRLTEGANVFSATTNASGVAVFNLDDATYDPVALTKAGFSFSGTTLVVSADASVTYTMTAITIDPPPSATTSTGVMTTLDEKGVVEDGVEISVRMRRGPGTAGLSYDVKDWTETSAGGGLVSFVGLVRGGVYRLWRGDETEKFQEFTVPDSDSFDIAEVLGDEE
jgi:hypothetical protein